MGAGASSGKGKGKSAGASAQLKKAQASEEEAKALFAKLDANSDGKLSAAEIKDAYREQKRVKKYGKDLKATWTDSLVDEVVSFFDRDTDGMLDLTEFTEVLSELKTRGSIDSASLKARAAAAEEAAKKKAECKKMFDTYAKEGGVWDKSATGKLVRKYNDEENYWDDFPGKVTTAHAALTGQEGRTATATFDQFVVWYPTLLSEMDAIKVEWAAAAAAAKTAAEAKKASEFEAGKPEWEVFMKRLPDALHAAWEQGKTPLLIDVTTPSGDNKNAGFSPLENYYSYSGDVIIELKKAVVETGLKKEKSVAEVQAEFAKKTLLALKQGRQLVLLCSNSAPPLRSKFASDIFPYELLDATKVKPLLEQDAKLEESFLAPLLEWMKAQGLDKDPPYNVAFVHADFRVVVVTKFDPADYKEYLGDELPFEHLQPV